MTADTLLRVRERVADYTGVRWTDATLYRYLNDGFLAVANQLDDEALFSLYDLETTSLVTGTVAYALPSDFLRERMVAYKSVYATRLNVRDLHTNSLQTPSETEPYYYIWGGSLRFTNSVTNAGTDTFKLWYIKKPTAVAAGVETELGDAYHGLAEDYAVALALMETDGAWGYAQWLMELFREEVGIINARFGGPTVFEGVPSDV